MGNIVEIESLHYTYSKGQEALKNINLTIKEGEFLVIMGANGAGKTTLCLTLNGIIPSTTGGEFRGVIRVKGMDTLERRVYELAEHVGMVQQNPEAQLFMANLEQELAFGPENLCVDPQEIRKRITQALRDVRLEGMEKRSPADLSGGQKQRAAIASALTMQSDILVLDEPTSQLDPVGTDEVFSVVKDLNKKMGKTIIMAEHKSEEIAEFADRIVLLDNGSIVAEGSPSEVFSQVELLHKVNV
ncbi:MAG: energy-coupling factor ABC transporter ATP-binding protein, partial [Candidatus Ranarchaeia archaeon]